MKWLLLVALLMIATYVIAPTPQWQTQIFPGQTPNRLAFDSHSHASWTGDSLVSKLVYTLQSPAKTDAYASGGWTMDPKRKISLNWSFLDTIHLEIRGTGCSEALLRILTFDPDYSKEDKEETYRPLLKEIPLEAQWKQISLVAEELYIPDFWYTQQGIAKKYDRKYLETPRVFEFANGWNCPHHQESTIEIRSIVLQGSSNRYFGWLVFGLLSLTIVALGLPKTKHKVAKT